jgi:hypothetical protein
VDSTVALYALDRGIDCWVFDQDEADILTARRDRPSCEDHPVQKLPWPHSLGELLWSKYYNISWIDWVIIRAKKINLRIWIPTIMGLFTNHNCQILPYHETAWSHMVYSFLLRVLRKLNPIFTLHLGKPCIFSHSIKNSWYTQRIIHLITYPKNIVQLMSPSWPRHIS